LKAFDKLLAVLGLAGEHQVRAIQRCQLFAYNLQHLYELAEDEDLVALVAEFFDEFEEGIELGGSGVALRGIDQARVAADLSHAQQRGEDVEAFLLELGVALQGEESAAGLADFGLIKFELNAVHVAGERFLDAVGKLGGDLRFGAAEKEVAGPGEESGGRIGSSFVVLRLERLLAAEESGHGVGEKAPEVEGFVFDWRTREHDTVSGVERARGFCGLGRGILDVLSFIEDASGPILR